MWSSCILIQFFPPHVKQILLFGRQWPLPIYPQTKFAVRSSTWTKPPFQSQNKSFADSSNGEGDIGIKIKVNTFIQPGSPFSRGITQQPSKQNPTSHWFQDFLPSLCNSYKHRNTALLLKSKKKITILWYLLIWWMVKTEAKTRDA